jgi:4-carboxymuconolactone decarboxylase
MDVFHPSGRETEPVDPAHFTGGGTLIRMPGICRDPAINAYRVSFESGARTDWHTHTGPQLLIVTEGRCRVQKMGEPVREVAAGGIVTIEPGEVHWHGATPDAPTTHLALNVAATTDWLRKVTDEEYAGEADPS